MTYSSTTKGKVQTPLVTALALLAALITTSFITLPLSTAAHADFQAELDAALKNVELGDYETATKQLAPLFDLALVELAQIGHPNSAFQLGKKIISNDQKATYAEGISYLKVAADAGHTEARLHLGILYLEGVNAPKNIPAGIKLLELAALDGNLQAIHNLAMMKLLGLNMSVDAETAIDYFRIAAFRGHAAAQLSLAKLYAHGQGVPENRTIALAFLLMAKDGDDTEISAMANRIIGEEFSDTTSVQKDTAKNLAAECLSSKFVLCQFLVARTSKKDR